MTDRQESAIKRNISPVRKLWFVAAAILALTSSAFDSAGYTELVLPALAGAATLYLIGIGAVWREYHAS